ncbi:MAG: DUF4143 domain-containing protein [Vicinamibacterales bacterium]
MLCSRHQSPRRAGAHNGYSRLFDGLFYWAPSQGTREVDFLLQRGRELIAIEVKATSRPQAADFAGLKAVAELPQVSRRVLVHTGQRAFTTDDGVEALPVTDFVRLVERGRL